jgi:hypothetical protein
MIEIQEGNICRNEGGDLGIVIGVNEPCIRCGRINGPVWFGEMVGDNPSLWISSRPVKVAESLEDYEQGNVL